MPLVFSECQARPRRPRPAVCSSAMTSVPCGSPSGASARAAALLGAVLEEGGGGGCRQEGVGAGLELVAGLGVAFDADAEAAQRPGPAPPGRAADADLAGDLRPADDHGGVVHQEAEQPVNAAVGGAGYVAGRRASWHKDETPRPRSGQARKAKLKTQTSE